MNGMLHIFMSRSSLPPSLSASLGVVAYIYIQYIFFSGMYFFYLRLYAFICKHLPTAPNVLLNHAVFQCIAALILIYLFFPFTFDCIFVLISIDFILFILLLYCKCFFMGFQCEFSDLDHQHRLIAAESVNCSFKYLKCRIYVCNV